MIANVFRDLCTSIWSQGDRIPAEDGGYCVPLRTKDGVEYTNDAREIAKVFGGKIHELPSAGAFVAEFEDDSNALCGARGLTVISLWYGYDDNGLEIAAPQD